LANTLFDIYTYQQNPFSFKDHPSLDTYFEQLECFDDEELYLLSVNLNPLGDSWSSLQSKGSYEELARVYENLNESLTVSELSVL
jgi:hypothetical protein